MSKSSGYAGSPPPAPGTPPTSPKTIMVREDRTGGIDPEFRRLDALAQLLESSGICAAVAVDPTTRQIIVCHNIPSEEISALTKDFAQLFKKIVAAPAAEVPLDELLEIVARSISGTTTATRVSAQMVEADLYTTLLDGTAEIADRVGIFRRLYQEKKGGLSIVALRQSLSNIYQSTQGSLAAQMKALNASKIALGEKYEKEVEALKERVRGVLEPLRNVVDQLNEMREKDGDVDVIEAIERARPYLEQQQRKRVEGIEKGVEALLTPLRPDGHSASKLFINLDKLILDLREGRGALYAACSGDREPFIVVEDTVDPANPEKEMHAEMKVARYFINRFIADGGAETDLPRYLKLVLPYIGISKLGCFECALVLEVLEVENRGHHGTLSTEWFRPRFLDSLPSLATRYAGLRFVRTPTKDKTTVMYPDPSPSPVKPGADVASGSPSRVRAEAVRREIFGRGSPSGGRGGGPGHP